MSLREQAALDARGIVEDPSGFGTLVSVTNPAGVTASVMGLTRDIAATIDPGTGLVVTGRSASVTLSLATLGTAGLGVPRNIPDRDKRPWVITFTDALGTLHTFKVAEAMPDYGIGLVVCKLEAYKPQT